MKNLFRLAAYTFLLTGLVFAYSCKDDTTQTEPEPEKTLNKALLYDKVWYAQDGQKHEFKTGGVYRSTGTWEWLNNSDSMAIKATSNSQTFKWYFKYCTEHEMACTFGWDGKATNSWIIYKDQEW